MTGPLYFPNPTATKAVRVDAEELRKLVLGRLAAAGYVIGQDGKLLPPSVDKEGLRLLHRSAVQLKVAAHRAWLQRYLPRYLSYFAGGDEVIPERITPALVEVTHRHQQNLFRVARLLWSIPLSEGYGRRVRFLILDQANGKLIGLLSLQSPPISFSVRDRLFGYPPDRKVELVNQTMDIHTLGAVPPYNCLLGGKLAALAAASNEIRLAYQRKYAQRITQMERRILPPHLVALTTTSALGRSSLYNRLKYRGIPIAESLGYTEGYGTFHLEEFYPLFREFLKGQGVSVRGGLWYWPTPKVASYTASPKLLGPS